MAASYYVATPLPGGLHMTVCYMYHLSPSEVTVVQDDMAILSPKIFPLTLEFGERKLVGEKHDIPVQLVHLPEREKVALLDEFYQRWYRPQPGTTTRPSQTFHVTLGADGKAKDIGSTMTVDSMYLEKTKKQ